MKPQRTVVHVIAPAEVGGAESVVRELATERHRLGGRTEVVTLLERSGPHPLVDGLRESGIPVHVVCPGHRRYRAQIGEVSDILARCGASLVHTHVYHANFIGYWAARRLKRPLVATFHGFIGGGWKQNAYQWLDSRLLRRFHRVVCVSDELRERLIRSGCEPARVVTIPNGYRGVQPLTREVARTKLGIPEDARAVGWVGRLSHEKGPDLLLQAIGQVAAERVIAVFVGTGEEQARLMRLASDLGLSAHSVRFVGQRTDAAALLRAFDVLAISSRTEGLPMVLLEATMAGTPVVAFAVGGIPHVMSGDCGWLVEPGNVSRLADALTEALRDRTQAANRADIAQHIMRTRLQPERWVTRLEAVYEHAINVGAPRR